MELNYNAMVRIVTEEENIASPVHTLVDKYGTQYKLKKL